MPEAPAATAKRVRNTRRRTALIVTAIVALAALLYGTVVALYALGGQVSELDASGVPEDAEAVVVIRPQTVDAATDRLGLVVDLSLSDSLTTDGLAPDAPVHMLVSAAAGSRTLEFPASSVLSPTSISLITDGLVEQWPFDAHEATTTFLLYQEIGDEIRVIPTFLVADGRVPGWSISAKLLDDMDIVVDGQQVDVPVVEFTATRAGSTIAFGLVLLALMVIMPTVVLVVAINAFRGRRRVEATFLSWIGAMLFATIPMRTFLPGSPPIGSWVDFLLVLWVFVALIAGLIVFVAAWMRWSPRPEPPPVDPPPSP